MADDAIFRGLRLIKEFGENYAKGRLDCLAWALAETGSTSPIEYLMGIALIAMDTDYISEHINDVVVFKHLPVEPDAYRPVIAVIPQHPVGKYTLDFAVRFRAPDDEIHLIAIECDGHEFHERTKAQAAHDRQRDRFLTRSGWKVFRFTGSEIYNRPQRCAMEVMAYIAGTLGYDLSEELERIAS